MLNWTQIGQDILKIFGEFTYF